MLPSTFYFVHVEAHHPDIGEYLDIGDSNEGQSIMNQAIIEAGSAFAAGYS